MTTISALLRRVFGAGYAPFPRADVRLVQLEEQLAAHARAGDWQRYRATRLRLARHLRRAGRDTQALAALLDLCYLDANGPRTIGSFSGARLGTEDPSFDPARAPLDSGLLRQALALAARLNMDLPALQLLYLDVATVTWRALRLPLSPKVAWMQIGPALLPVRTRRRWPWSRTATA